MREIEIRAWCPSLKEFLPLAREVAFIDDEGKLRSRIEGIIFNEYTGLKDKHGRKIYEGDIILVYGEKRVVQYQTAWWIALTPEVFWKLYQDPTTLPAGFGSYQNTETFKPMYRYAEPEVIGNIYENPELVER